ncbi:hypothetical protein UB31_27580 [Bradyrhizobium sp. LTSP849]|uniref:hypothetical protein n=1 Tax=Bradyrhizobium sp. LTSP849 TaxID=1615890 RepID=UPI0005D2B458|nr:hypothetical protein [Bradyrhizobium sp. LTSP849]KJC40670.1 hypothetical protein UB31_27580 [Bradyrhizobium sp. LTSP849]
MIALVKSFIPRRSDIFTRISSRTTLKAWKPFYECVGILFQLQNSDLDDDHPEWRIYWFAGLALLRTVGHVLDKIDGTTSDQHRRIINATWESWKRNRAENAIFWDFVEQERNNLLKTYEFGVEIDDEGLLHKESGRDGGQLFREAVYWWRFQLEKLEQELTDQTSIKR